MIGLGRMGANIVRRLINDGHYCVVYAVGRDAVTELEGDGALGTNSVDDFVEALQPPRVAWVMVPAGVTGKVVDALAEGMAPGDIISDGRQQLLPRRCRPRQRARETRDP